MTKFITIESWFTTKSIQANKPTKWQRLLAYLNLKPLEKPKYWWEVDITIHFPHPLRVGDIILARNLFQYSVMSKKESALMYSEVYKITSIEPSESCMPELGKTVILASAYSEMDPNTQPYGGMII